MAIGSANDNKIVLELQVGGQAAGLSEADRQLLNNFKENTENILKKTESDDILLANGETISKSELKGDKGDTGERGQRGERGLQGEQGIQGIQGADGKSAYQLWLDSGNQGSEQDFLNSLKGEGLSEEEKQQLIKKGETDNILLENGTSITTTDLLNNAVTIDDSIPQNIDIQTEGNKIQFKQTSESKWTDLPVQPFLTENELDKQLITKNRNGIIEYSFQGENTWFPFQILSELSGIDIVKRLLLKKLRPTFVSVEDYGADVNVEDNTDAIHKAIAAAASRRAVLWFNGIYKCKGIVYVPSGLTISGANRNTCGITNSYTNITFCVGNNVTFNNLFIENKGGGRHSFYVHNVIAPTIYNCKINGRVTCLNDTTKIMRGIDLSHCEIICDFENSYDGVQQYDVIACRGYVMSRITNNYIDVKNVHRIFKFHQGNYGGTISDYITTSLTNTRDVVISGNFIKGSGGKQVVDAFDATSCFKFINNHFELVDDPERGSVQWSTVVNFKTPYKARDINDIGDSVIIDGNTGTIPCQFLYLQGSYGAELPHDNSRKNHAKITNNVIRNTSNEFLTNGLVYASFYNSVITSGNTFEVQPVPNNYVYLISSSEKVVIDESDTIIGGMIRISKSKTNSGSERFSGIGGDVTVKATIRDYDCDAALVVADVNLNRIEVDGVKSYPKLEATKNCRPIHFVGTERIGTTIIKNCVASSKNNGNIIPIIDTNASANLTQLDNNWQPRFRGYVQAPPTSGDYIFGDSVANLYPYGGRASEWVCIHRSSSGVLSWKASKWTIGSGTTEQRPTLSNFDVGVEYFDTTLDKFVKWNGSKWG